MADNCNTAPDAQAQWDNAIQRLAEAEAAYRHYDRAVWLPAYELELAFEESHGLTSPGKGRVGSPDYFEKRKKLRQAHPKFYTPDEVSDEMERLANAYADAQTALMELEAPNLGALRWKLDHTLELEHATDSDDGSIPSWTGTYVRQLLSDYRRLLPEAA